MDVQNPAYAPDGQPPYPRFNVSLQSPLPTTDTFIDATTLFALPSLLKYAAILIAVIIMRSIIEAFKK